MALDLHFKTPTPQKAVVVVPHSQFKCTSCAANLPSAVPVCEFCGNLNEIPEGLSPFEVLGLEESLCIGEAALRTRFYTLSKITHPDRYATAAPCVSLMASRWSAAVNRAYQVLKDPEQRAGFFIRRAGLDEPKSSIPMELAETYFELQEALCEPQGEALLSDFRKRLIQQLAEMEIRWKQMEVAWDTEPNRQKLLEEIQKHFTLRRFLNSMLSDIDKKRSH